MLRGSHEKEGGNQGAVESWFSFPSSSVPLCSPPTSAAAATTTTSGGRTAATTDPRTCSNVDPFIEIHASVLVTVIVLFTFSLLVEIPLTGQFGGSAPYCTLRGNALGGVGGFVKWLVTENRRIHNTLSALDSSVAGGGRASDGGDLPLEVFDHGCTP